MRPRRVVPDDDELFTLAEVARWLHVHQRTVNNLVLSGELRSTRIGKRSHRVKRAWVEDYLARRDSGGRR